MTAIVGIHRGMNLAAYNRVKMDDLRKLYESTGLVDPQTYIQSGNVIFGSRSKDLDKVAKSISAAVESTLGFRSEAILRTTADLKEIIAKNPFSKRTDVAPNVLMVIFLAHEPSAEDRATLTKRIVGPEEVHMVGREMYVHYSGGLAKSKLTTALIDKALNTTASARNWNTVTKLFELAQQWEAAH